MTDATAEKPQTPEARKESPEPQYVFPEYPKGDFGLYHMDKKSLTLWIGVSVDPNVQDYTGATAFLRSMDHILFQWYKELAAQMRLRQQLAVKPPTQKTGIFGLGGKK